MNYSYEESEKNHHGLPYETAEQEYEKHNRKRQQITECYKVVMEILRQTNTPEDVRNLIDALIFISAGKDLKEPLQASDSAIARAFYKDEDYCEALKKRVRRWRIQLEKWQETTGVTFVQFVRDGYQDYEWNDDGTSRTKNIPAKYRVVILEMAAEVLSKEENVSIDAAVRSVLGKFGDVAVRLCKKQTREINGERCRKSLFTWARKTLEIAEAEGCLEEELADLRKEFQDFLNDYKKESGTNSSRSESFSGSNDNTITLYSSSSSSFSIDTHSIIDEGSYSTDKDFSEYTSLDFTARNLSMLCRAVECARLGFRVFPVHNVVDAVCSCRYGAECYTKGKHPRIVAWQISATTDESKIKEWWRKWRRANVGIVTGEYGGLNKVVLDIDTKSNGFKSLTNLEKEFGILPETLTAKTGGGGQHRFFLAPAGLRVGNVQNSIKLGQGLDIRGDNGFIVGAGSIHASGNRYEWLNAAAPITAMPAWLIEKLTAVNEAESVCRESFNDSKTMQSKANLNDSEVIREHEGRNNFLFREAISLFYGGYQKAEVHQRVSGWNNRVCLPPVSTAEVEKLVNSAEKTWKKKLPKKQFV